METHRRDWMSVVYGPDLGGEPPRGGEAPATEISVRHSPSDLDPVSAPGGEQRVRVTVVPSEPALRWVLYLRDFGPGPGEAPAAPIWWRVEPGTWQPLGGTRQRVAEGRGRVRLDVELRVNPDLPEGTPRPRLRFVAESS